MNILSRNLTARDFEEKLENLSTNTKENVQGAI
jgi:hypothetical protein